MKIAASNSPTTASIFETEIGRPTEHREPPPTFTPIIEKPEFSQDPAPPPPAPGSGPEPPPQPPKENKDPTLTAETTIATVDVIQHLWLFSRHKKKLQAKYFKTDGEYTQAVDLKHTPDEVIKKDEKAAEKLSLLSRYNAYLKQLEQAAEKLPFSDEERMMLQKPMQRLIELNPSLDLPPGAALAVAGFAIAAPRYMELQSD